MGSEMCIRDSFLIKMVYGYFAFEALRDHGYYFQSIAYGNFPKVMTVDGCVKVATDDVTFARFAVAREVRSLDADLQHQLLKLSMMSPMLFAKRLRFITEAAPTFGPFNRVSNMVSRSARCAMPGVGSPEIGDGSRLVEFLSVTENGISSLRGMKMGALKSIYRLCLDGGKGVSK